MKVEWRPSALDDRDAIIEYLEPLNPHAAVNLLQALILAGDSLTLFPYRGRPGLAAGTRELVAVWPYLIVYEIDDEADTANILRIWHGAQDR
ncbi:type II toxin-antitoxin system RelE/ParE family toxin [Acidithiobacillus sp.]|uniref:type II toxin-antitoxin system RelE/ParE family toxin n=1 Tax=Acidithiobacillus sp. TaxID=1872118 RepID=UPI0031FF10FE